MIEAGAEAIATEDIEGTEADLEAVPEAAGKKN